MEAAACWRRWCGRCASIMRMGGAQLSCSQIRLMMRSATSAGVVRPFVYASTKSLMVQRCCKGPGCLLGPDRRPSR